MPIVSPTRPEHAAELEGLQRIVFPTLAEEERLHAPQYLRHLEVFPAGQFVMLSDGHVIGVTTTMRYDIEPGGYGHVFDDVFAGGWLGRHEPAGKWMYGLDMGIHPDHRGRGFARMLYRARQELVRQLGLSGQITVGMMNGYGAVANRLSGDQYYREWLEGVREDPTLTPQRKIGFEPLGLLPGYLHDPACGDYGVLLRLDAGTDV